MNWIKDFDIKILRNEISLHHKVNTDSILSHIVDTCAHIRMHCFDK